MISITLADSMQSRRIKVKSESHGRPRVVTVKPRCSRSWSRRRTLSPNAEEHSVAESAVEPASACLVARLHGDFSRVQPPADCLRVAAGCARRPLRLRPRWSSVGEELRTAAVRSGWYRMRAETGPVALPPTPLSVMVNDLSLIQQYVTCSRCRRQPCSRFGCAGGHRPGVRRGAGVGVHACMHARNNQNWTTIEGDAA